MTEIQQNRWDQLVRRASGIVGGGSQVNDTLNELFPVLDVERVPGELLALMGTGIAWGRVIAIAVVGENSRAQLFNPVGSGKILTVSKFLARTDADNAVELGTLAVALTSLSAVPRFRDTRFGANVLPAGELRLDSNVGATPATFRMRTLALESAQLEDVNSIAVLTPGFGLVASGVSVNTSVEASFIWRERVAEPSELNL